MKILNPVVITAVILTCILNYIFGIEGLGPIDDHQFIRTIFKGEPFGAYVVPEMGRFVPLTAQEYVLASKLIAPSPILFYTINCCKIFILAFLLFCCLQYVKQHWTLLPFWAVVVLSIGFANSAARFHVGEINALALLLVFILSALISDKSKNAYLVKAASFLGLIALGLSFLYKELIFSLALTFCIAEFFRFNCNNRLRVPLRIWATLAISVAYVFVYGLWRILYTNHSYADLLSLDIWHVIGLFADNDPFIVFIVLPIALYRFILIVRNRSQHLIYDSFLAAASAYAVGFLLLQIYNTYYLLPAYGFASVGLYGLTSDRFSCFNRNFVSTSVLLLCLNNLPISISDMQILKSIANNHYKFVQFLSDWMWLNPNPSTQQRNLVLMGVSPGSGIEIIVSLRTYLESFGVPGQTFNIRFTEKSDNAAISKAYSISDESGYLPGQNDVIIFNPYQKIALPPPLFVPFFDQIYRSESEWVWPRWSALKWINACINNRLNCSQNISAGLRYSGYAAMLVKRMPKKSEQLQPLLSPSFRIGPLLLESRMRARSIKKIDVFFENTGNETWPSVGKLQEGMYVNLAYRWFNENNSLILEGSRVPLPTSILPGDRVKASLYIRTPSTPGKYRLFISPVQEGVQWFEASQVFNIECI